MKFIYMIIIVCYDYHINLISSHDNHENKGV